MKRFLLLATALCLFFMPDVNAQQRGPREKLTPEQQADRMVKRLNEELKLSDKQQTDLKTWFTESIKKREEEFQKNKTQEREAMRTQMKKNREATDAKLKEVLTPEQYKTYKENEEKRMKEMQQRRPANANPNRRSGGGFPRN